MGSNVETIKERLNIAEVISGYVKLEKAGASLKGRCPFHSEKTPSFFVSPVRQSYYCFGCGAKGDIFTFIEEVEGLEFKEALKLLADKAGVELVYEGRGESRSEKDRLYACLEEAARVFEKEFIANSLVRQYLLSRGATDETIKDWRVGFARDDWRTLYGYLRDRGFEKELIIKAGLAKVGEKGGEPYDVFRNRIIFPLSDTNGNVIAFSGRLMAGAEDGPKYLNSPDTPLFTKSEVLYGLDKAKISIRKRNFAVLVEGQMDLILSHQAGVPNTVATSGTAFTREHLGRLKNLSSRIIIAFDGDEAGANAAERSSILGLALGFEVKVALLPDGEDPAEVAKENPEDWKQILRDSKPAIEYFFNRISKEKDTRKLGKVIEQKILPMIKLLKSAIEQAHFITLISKRTGIKEQLLWEDLKRVKPLDVDTTPSTYKDENTGKGHKEPQSHREQIEERLAEIKLWQEDLPEGAVERTELEREILELNDNFSQYVLREELSMLSSKLRDAEESSRHDEVEKLAKRIQELHTEIMVLEERRKIL